MYGRMLGASSCLTLANPCHTRPATRQTPASLCPPPRPGYGLSGQEVWKVLAYGSSSSSSSSGAGDGSSSSSGGGPGGSSISISSFDGLSAGGNVTSGLVGAPGASPYAAGAAIVWLKVGQAWGWGGVYIHD